MSRPAPETISRDELGQRLHAQGVPRAHMAFRCWMCGTVQSLASFALAGVDSFSAERQIGYSCIGRHTGAGAWDARDPARRAVPGCDWTLGGFLPGGALRIVEGARTLWAFAVATPDEARALMARGGQIEPPEVSAATQGQPETAASPARRTRGRSGRPSEAR